MRIQKYNAAGLKEFLESDEYRDMPNVPVSRHRALSWLNNPRLSPEDIIMYIGSEDGKMIAYRCILPDRHGEIRFGWLSGNWVRPDRRRMGLAILLFEEAWSDWGHQLMYTNYAPESKAVYDKSGRFELYRERVGYRYYQRSSIASLLGGRRTLYRRSRPLLSLTDGMINLVQDARIRLGRDALKGIDMKLDSRLDFEAVGFLEEHQGTGFCLRRQEDFDWISAYPWVITGAEKDESYFFSSVSPRFSNICLQLRDQAGDLCGVIWMVINGERMSLPYISFKPEAAEDISRILSQYMRDYHVSYFTCYQSPVNEIFQPGPILKSRKMIQGYFATRDLIKQLPDPGAINFQDGDGDVVFV